MRSFAKTCAALAVLLAPVACGGRGHEPKIELLAADPPNHSTLTEAQAIEFTFAYELGDLVTEVMIEVYASVTYTDGSSETISGPQQIDTRSLAADVRYVLPAETVGDLIDAVRAPRDSPFTREPRTSSSDRVFMLAMIHWLPGDPGSDANWVTSYAVSR